MMKFSFVYDGKKIRSSELKAAKIGNVTEYRVGDIKITQTAKKFVCGAEYSLLNFENVGNKNSGIISDISDIDDIVLSGVKAMFHPGRNGYYGDYTKLSVMRGNDLTDREGLPAEEVFRHWGRVYRCTGGRSSQTTAPFFEIRNADGKTGVLATIGWTGQWQCRFEYEGGKARMKAGVEGAEFYLEPGEKIRTASVLVLPYSDGSVNAHNIFRRLIKDEFSIIGKPGRGNTAPFSFQSWGGARSEFLIKQIEKAKDRKFGFEYFWLDAGWYGDYTEECPNEFCPAWGKYTGDWTVNKIAHPNGLEPVFEKAAACGMKGLLWMEPERVRTTTKFYPAHPEMFIDIGAESGDVLLDLSEKKNQDYMIEVVSHYVKELKLSCYRQDFNLDPLPYWQSRDTEGRRGICHIKYITGLYRVWDELLARFPHLIIDNCSSGGRRIDIETLSRSIPLWRSDVNCWFDFDPESAQNQNIGFSYWMPYHGCGLSAYPQDKYRVRSTHAVSLATTFLGYEEFAKEKYDAEQVKSNFDEYLDVRSFYDKDFYPVFGFPTDKYSWAGWQFHDPEKNEGIVVAFRRAGCESDTVKISLGGFVKDAKYVFTDKDTGERFSGGGELVITLPQKRSSKVLVYRAE